MLRVKVRQVREGLHPNEVIVEVTTSDGTREELVVDKRSLRENSLLIGYPLGGDDKKNLLVELPRETTRGHSRVWVPGESLIKEKAA